MAQGDPWYAFRSVSYRWVDQNPRSRQEATRAILERMFKKPFVKVRPAFLRNPATKRCLELDMYNAELHIAAEVSGIQHYQFPNPFHSTLAKFQDQCKRDALKKELCIAHSVQLIVIPYDVPYEGLEEFLRAHLHDALLRSNRAAETTMLAEEFERLERITLEE
jgi:hypothetical protein